MVCLQLPTEKDPWATESESVKACQVIPRISCLQELHRNTASHTLLRKDIKDKVIPGLFLSSTQSSLVLPQLPLCLQALVLFQSLEHRHKFHTLKASLWWALAWLLLPWKLQNQGGHTHLHIGTATGVPQVTQGKPKARYCTLRTAAACPQGDQHWVGLAHAGFAPLANWPWGLSLESWRIQGDKMKECMMRRMLRNREVKALGHPVGCSAYGKFSERLWNFRKVQGSLGPEKPLPATTLARSFPANPSLSLMAKDFCSAASAYLGVLVPANTLILFLAYTVKFHFVSETSSSPRFHYCAFAEATLFYRLITSAV